VPDEVAGRRRLGIFGSAFNPPHTGHLILVAEALWRLELDGVRVVPTGEPYHKDSDYDPGREERLQLAREAFSGEPACEVSDLETNRPGPSYTVDTLRQVATEEPEADLVLLLGADAALGLPDWKDPTEVFELAQVAVAPRPGVDRDEVEEAVTGAGGGRRTTFFPMPRTDITATLIRERIGAGEPFGHLVPQRVAERIMERGLYVG
jgi:nicotinate-nucleotide adenylyltransferase